MSELGAVGFWTKDFNEEYCGKVMGYMAPWRGIELAVTTRPYSSDPKAQEMLRGEWLEAVRVCEERGYALDSLENKIRPTKVTHNG